MNGTCTDCGRPASGIRCRSCHGKSQALLAAQMLQHSDRELLKLVDEEHLSNARIATRYQSSRQNIGIRIRRARNRQEILKYEEGRQDMADDGEDRIYEPGTTKVRA